MDEVNELVTELLKPGQESFWSSQHMNPARIGTCKRNKLMNRTQQETVAIIERCFVLVQQECMEPEPERSEFFSPEQHKEAYSRWIQGNYPMDDSY